MANPWKCHFTTFWGILFLVVIGVIEGLYFVLYFRKKWQGIHRLEFLISTGLNKFLSVTFPGSSVQSWPHLHWTCWAWTHHTATHPHHQAQPWNVIISIRNKTKHGPITLRYTSQEGHRAEPVICSRPRSHSCEAVNVTVGPGEG